MRREVRGLRHDLVEVFDDDRGIDDDAAVVVESGHHPVGIEREVVRLELVASEEVELLFREGQVLGIEDEPDPLAAGRLRRVVERERHGSTFCFVPPALIRCGGRCGRIPADCKPDCGKKATACPKERSNTAINRLLTMR
jgi:hypothetical protein